MHMEISGHTKQVYACDGAKARERETERILIFYVKSIIKYVLQFIGDAVNPNDLAVAVRSKFTILKTSFKRWQLYDLRYALKAFFANECQLASFEISSSS